MTPLLALGLLIAALAFRLSWRRRSRPGAARTAAVARAARTARPALGHGESAQLRGARVCFHAITAAPEPAAELGDLPDLRSPSAHGGDATSASVWRYLDVSIELAERDEGARGDGGRALALWDPGALAVVASPTAAAPAVVDSVDVMQGGRWVPLEGDRVIGGQRVRLHVSLPASSERLELRYGPEHLADLRDLQDLIEASRAADRASVS